jgi:hypothetical protein
MKEKLFKIIDGVQKYCEHEGTYCCDCKHSTYDSNTCWKYKIVDAILNSKLFWGPETLKEQDSHIYRWTAVEDDGYTHSEAGVANNMLDAFIKATEYSPSYHKKIVIEKINDDELTEKERELKEFWINA